MANTIVNSPVQFAVEGMTCASCAGRVEKALIGVKGVESATVNLATEKVQINATHINWATISAAVTQAGYKISTETITLNIAGMTCASCVGRVEKALLALSHIETLTSKIDDLQKMRQSLQGLADNCLGNELPDCPIIAGLAVTH